jgi:hypothetical protein
MYQTILWVFSITSYDFAASGSDIWHVLYLNSQ